MLMWKLSMFCGFLCCQKYPGALVRPRERSELTALLLKFRFIIKQSGRLTGGSEGAALRSRKHSLSFA